MEIKTSLPQADIEQILNAVRARTRQPITLIEDGTFGPWVFTGRYWGWKWWLHRTDSGWEVKSKHIWVI